MPITKHNFTVRKVEELADTMRAGRFRIAQSGRKGPVLVDIPRMSLLLSVSSPPSSRSRSTP